MAHSESGVASQLGLATAVGRGMIAGMTSAKVAISLPKAVLARARAAVRRGDAPSLSAYVCKALEEMTGDDDVIRMLDEMLEKTGGPPTPEEIRWADGVIGISKKRYPKPKHLK
jgi:hypothetical protein